MAKKKPPVSQSRTMWVKKGTIVNGEAVKKGYVAQYGKPEKRVTNRVKLEVDTPKRGKKGDVVTLKSGRYVTKKPGSGTTGGTGAGAGGGTGRGAGTSAAAKTAGAGKKYEEKKASMRPGARPAASAASKTPPNRKATSGTVSSGIAAGKAQGASKSPTSNGKRWNEPGGGGLAGPNSPLRGLFSGGNAKKGDKRVRYSGGRRIIETFDGKNWR